MSAGESISFWQILNKIPAYDFFLESNTKINKWTQLICLTNYNLRREMISQISLRKSFPKSFSFISESVAEFAPFNFTTWQLETVCTRQTTKYIVYSKKQSMHAFSSQLTSKKNHFLFFPSWSVDPNGQMSCHKPNSSLQPPHRKKKKSGTSLCGARKFGHWQESFWKSI